MRKVLIAILALALTAGLALESWGLAAARSGRSQARAEAASATHQLSAANARLARLTAEQEANRASVARLVAQLHADRARSARMSKKLDSFRCFENVDSPPDGPPFTRGPLVGDVDGDGVSDHVYTVGTYTMGPRSRRDPCRYSLLVVTQHGGVTAPITIPARYGYAFDLRDFLSPDALIPLNQEPGDEIVVQIHQGASTVFGVVFTLSAGRLVQMNAQGAPGGVFAWAGSAGVGDALDCVKGQPGAIVSSGYEYAKNYNYYDVSRTFYRAESVSFVTIGHQHFRVKVDAAERKFPGLFQEVEFPTCPERVPRAIVTASGVKLVGGGTK